MKFDDQQIQSIGDLINILKSNLDGYTGPVWYRGQARDTWHLEPKLLRRTPIPSESHLLNRFKQDASFILDRLPKSNFDWLFLMQHYAIPTRLLDWTESPLVGLYFAILSEPDNDGAIWVLCPTVLNKKSNFRPEFENEIPSFEDEHLQNYLPETIAHESKSKLFPMAAI